MKTSAQLRVERLEKELGLPSLSVEEWQRTHLRFLGGDRKSQGHRKRQVSYHTAIRAAVRKVDAYAKRRLTIRVRGVIKTVNVIRILHYWYDEETGKRMVKLVYRGKWGEEPVVGEIV